MCQYIPFKVKQYFACCIFFFGFYSICFLFSLTHTLDISLFRLCLAKPFVATVITYFDDVINVLGLAENQKKKHSHSYTLNCALKPSELYSRIFDYMIHACWTFTRVYGPESGIEFKNEMKLDRISLIRSSGDIKRTKKISTLKIYSTYRSKLTDLFRLPVGLLPVLCENLPTTTQSVPKIFRHHHTKMRVYHTNNTHTTHIWVVWA